ncbi:GTPase activating protein [Blastomyces dermatitidis ATCC 18188]|uniref:GTPase-activating protein GYP5 n=1 Tax=Ajellomyces dermatitidis (strain ATCC 18188 / CBS 674.68) TaxID=653446 RepID=F2T7R6_AJEDA|nr:GTPase activating protein [Blastomyces dermatitidis ATCC 18188]
MVSSSAENTDYEADAFEDAQDTAAQRPESPIPQSATRSLTDRRPSNGSLTTPRATTHPPLPIPEMKPSGQDDTLSPVSPVGGDETPKKQKPAKSPLLTAHRLSTTSLDEINLAAPKEGDEDEKTQQPSSDSSTGPPPLPSRDSQKQTGRLQGFSASLPSVPWGPPPSTKHQPPTTQLANPPQPSRKLTSPFSWLSRASTGGKDVKPSSGSVDSRRNTAASISTVGSNPELLARLQEGSDGDSASLDSRRQLRNSLRDQFKQLRMRNEGISDEAASVTSGQDDGRTSVIGSPASGSDRGETGLAAPSASSPVATSPGLPPTVNPNLAPGTVSGISSSATDASAPVDWELWQHIVNLGPEALKGSNAEELNAAIKRGIPQTIRGVIWQVLADSRNPELEDVYRELLARGTEKDRDRYWSISSAITLSGQGNGVSKDKEKESLTSSRSSVDSGRSSPTANSTNGVVSPLSIPEKDSETVLKAQASLEAARKKKSKEDAIALQKLEKAIRRDLGSRTSYSKYFLSQRNQDGLFGLCKAYALYDEGVGYAQGMNFIVMPLLFNMDEGEAFTLLVKLMNKYRLRDMFIQDMPGLHMRLYQFERLLEDLEPALACHLRRRGVTPQLYATQWFLTLFAYRFPLQLVLRIYDLIFEEGLEPTILRFAVAIMQRNTEALLEMNDMTSLTNFLKEKLFDVYIDQQPSASSILESGFFGSSGSSDKEVYRADLMVQDACAVKLSNDMIKTYTAEWEEKVRVEKEQAAELEGLRHTVATQAARIRLLEERAEKSDTEHVQLASELVRLKVENEELRDANESYKVEVQELKIVIDRQPAELEETLRTEMDRIMKRNIEVQNENRAMEEQMAEMEKDLVDTKLKWAEMSEEHESLKQKWVDLRKALG